jgi:hypothetical protein
MGQFSAIRHAGVEMLRWSLVSGFAPCIFQQAQTGLRQRHKGSSLPAVHVRDGVNEPLRAKMPDVHPCTSVSRAQSLQFLHIDDSKGADSRQCSHVGFAQEVLTSSAPNSFALRPAWQIQPTAEDIAGDVDDNLTRASTSTQAGMLTVTVAMVDESVHCDTYESSCPVMSSITPSLVPSCRSMCSSFRPVSRRKSHLETV